MNRLWVRLWVRLWFRVWLGIMGAFVGLVISFEVAEVAVLLVRTAFPRLSGNETVAIIVSNAVGVLLSALFALGFAYWLYRTCSRTVHAEFLVLQEQRARKEGAQAGAPPV